MNSRKFIHCLLVAVLVYTQMVTSLHAVEHIGTAVHDGFAHDSHPGSHGIALHSAHATHDHSPSAAIPEAESNCTIYHTSLNQGSVSSTPVHHVMMIVRHLSVRLPQLTYPAKYAVQNLPIRGPPVLS
ncbi:MAG: hypothetical protein AB8B97_22530 [Granulosicoccus sp.]